MDHSDSTVLDARDLTEESLIDAVVYGAEDEKIGTVSHVHEMGSMGSATEVIVDVGGFLGIGAKSVMMSANDLTFMRDSDGDVHAMTRWTKEQVMALPEHMHTV